MCVCPRRSRDLRVLWELLVYCVELMYPGLMSCHAPQQPHLSESNQLTLPLSTGASPPATRDLVDGSADAAVTGSQIQNILHVPCLACCYYYSSTNLTLAVDTILSSFVTMDA